MVEALKFMLESGIVIEFWYDADEEVKARRWCATGHDGCESFHCRGRTLSKAVKDLKKVLYDAGILRLEVDKGPEV